MLLIGKQKRTAGCFCAVVQQQASPASSCAQWRLWGPEAVLVQAAHALEKARALILDLDSNPHSVADRLCDLRRFLI